MKNHDNYYAQLIRDNSKLLGKGFIYAQKHDFEDYPGIKICSNKEHKTTGELYKINTNLDHILNELDYYEGFDSKNVLESLFIRSEVSVYLDNNSEIKAWVYEYAKRL